MSFVHLHVHSAYSLEDGTIDPKKLVAAVAAAGMPAVAMTDMGNLFAAIRFYRAAMQAGVQPIFGAEMRIRNPEDATQPWRMVVLAQNAQGWLHLKQLISRGYREGQHQGLPLLEREWLLEKADGLMLLSGGRAGDVGQALLANDVGLARTCAERWQQAFADRFYFELIRTGRAGEEEVLHAQLKLAAKLTIPVVATNDVRFLKQEDFEAHEARVCIRGGWQLDSVHRPREYSEDQYLRSAEEMAKRFKDIPEALSNTVAIARRCATPLQLGEPRLPEFPIPAGMTLSGFFRKQAEEGLQERLPELYPQGLNTEQRTFYAARLQRELDVIEQMGFPGYFLIVSDFIRWAKKHGIPVGPGRGSGAGSLVAFSLRITDLDPLRYELLFERFLNPERVSMPDFDIDFCMERRDEVIDYVAETYGRDRVSQIITFGSMNAKAVVRDVARVLGYPYGFADRLAKLIPFDLKMTLAKALEESEELAERYKNEDDVRDTLDLAQALEGLPRNAGKHAGGVVISPSDINDFSPIYCESGGSSLVTQFDKDDVEAAGLVKFDFLGLRTLTILDWAVEIINRKRKEQGVDPLRLEALTLDDPDTYALFSRGDTTAVFQFESRGMKDYLRKLQPSTFEDIIALAALFRPGPLGSGMVDDFIERRHGRAKVSYPHPLLEPILKPTYGVIVYQEQVMQIAQVLAGYSLGGADLLRRAMGKKKPEEMAKQREIFMEGAAKNDIDPKQATSIFDLMEKFAEYGFNKSHSAAYALVAYHTAWLKAHEPAAFMAAVLSAVMEDTDKVVGLIEECRSMQLQVRSPDINRSEYRFGVDPKGRIVYGLGGIKGVGEAAIELIIQARTEKGAFADLLDLCRRVDHSKVNKRVMEALIRAGALDSLVATSDDQPAYPARASLLTALPLALAAAEREAEDRARGQEDLFGGPVGDTGQSQTETAVWSDVKPWSEEERLRGEKDTLGLYLTGHPFDRYERELAHVASTRLGNLQGDRNRSCTVAGLVVALQIRQTARGAMAFVTLDDRTGRVELKLFNEAYQRFRTLLERDRVLVAVGPVAVDEYSGALAMTVDELLDLDQTRSRYARALVLHPPESVWGPEFSQALAELLAPFREGGRCPVLVQWRQGEAQGCLKLGDTWKIQPLHGLMQRLAGWLGERNVRLEYPSAP